MKDWRAAVRSWESNGYKDGNTAVKAAEGCKGFTAEMFERAAHDRYRRNV